MVAPAAIACRQTSARNAGSERVASSAENSTSSACSVAVRTLVRTRSSTSGGSSPSLRAMCSALVAMNTWILERRAPARASAAASRSSGSVRASAATVAPATVRGDGLHALEVARRRDREAGLDHVYAEPLELRGDLGLLVGLQGDAGRLLAVAKSGVEDRDPAGWQLSSSSSRPVRGRTGGVVRSACALRGAWSKAPPRGGESRRRGGKSGRAQPPRAGLRNGCCARRSSLQVCKCCRAVPGLSSPSAIRSRTLTSSGPARTLLAMVFAANEIFAFLFLVARKPAC